MKKFRVDTNWAIALNFYMACVLGLCPLVYDRKRHVLRLSMTRSWLGLAIYGTAIALLIPLGYIASKRMEMVEMAIKDFASIIEAINGNIKVLSSIVSLVIFFKNRNNFAHCFNEILKLNRTTFKVYDKDAKIEKWFLWMILTKMAVGTLIAIVNTGMFFINFRKRSLIILGIFFCQCGTFAFQQFSVYFFYIAVGFVCKFYKMTNTQLFEVYEQYKTISKLDKLKGMTKETCCVLSDRIDEIGTLYKDLFYLHNFLKQVYDVQVLSILTTSFCTNVSFSFATYTLFSGETINTKAITIYVGATVLSFIDTYLTSAVCAANAMFFKEAKHILGVFASIKSLDIRFDRTIERTTFQLEKHSISYQLCGLLEINQKTSFMFLSASLTCFIILAQFDYKYGNVDLRKYLEKYQ
ncbi:hypothetical protein ACFFRR_000341 [Megaselia abdita]